MVREQGATKVERQPQNTVLVWPNLLAIEFLAAALITLGLIILSWVIGAPLEEHANPDITPNPSKAPWYFLNLQELLLHMHPSLAGVIVPGVAILMLMAVPYVDHVVGDTGRWFASENGPRIAGISAVYATVWLVALIIFDEYVGTRRVLESIGIPEVIISIVVPVAVMIGLSWLLVILIRPMQPNAREILIALFTGFVAVYVVLTIIGTAFRGPGMHLFWPWAMPPRH
ncbi:MAG: menaquinol-cytochrome C reductase [Chloroflexi bacterium]|nr:menaquinol-cytochrome C reductase [Chloroflexota bacterium]